MRVTQSEISRNLLSDIGTLNEDLGRFSRQVSSGKLLNQLKDSPSGSAELVSLAKLDSDIDQYRFNADAGTLYLSTADSILNEVNNLATSIYAKGSQAVSEIISDDGRAAFAGEIRSLRDQIVSLANSEVRGRYIFAGSEASAAPFLLGGDSITYQGDNTVNALSVDAGVEVQMNFSGNAVFNSTFAAISSLLTAIDGNDAAGIQAALSQFSPALSDLSKVRAQVGSNLSGLENVQSRLQLRGMSVTEQRSRIEDANMSQAAVQLKQTQTALDAAMSAAGSILTQRNLFDILG
jgi:flagellar hook-associated protein 3 FlgL